MLQVVQQGSWEEKKKREKANRREEGGLRKEDGQHGRLDPEKVEDEVGE